MGGKNTNSAKGKILTGKSRHKSRPEKPKKPVAKAAVAAGKKLKLAENALRESEGRLKAIIDYTPAAVVVKDLDAKIQTANKTYCDWYGMEQEDLIGERGYNFLDKKTATINAAHERKVVKELVVIEEERRITYPDGVTRDVQVQKFPVFDPNGKCIAVGTVINDITERKRTEESSRLLATAVEALTESVSLYDADERLVFFNERFRELNAPLGDLLQPGLKFEEFLRAAVDKGMMPNAHGRKEKWVRERLNHRRNQGPAFEARRQDGLHLLFKEHRMPDGGTLTIGTDITERKQAEAVNIRLGRIIEQSLNEIFIFDAKTLRFVQVNHGARQNLGYTMAELEKITPVDIKPDYTKRKFEKAIKPLRDGTQEQLAFETVHQRKDGSTYDVLVQLQLMQQETPAVFVAYIQDITERKKMREALQSSEGRLRGAIDSMQEGFALFDRDDRLVAINDEYRRLIPVGQEIFDKNGTFEELLRTNVERGVMSEALGREEEFIKNRLAEHRNPGKPIVRMLTDGSWYLVSETRTPEGGVAMAVTDITELKGAETALRLSEEKFREIAEVSSDLFWEMDENLRFTYLSDPKKDADPNAPNDVLGKTRWELAGADPDVDGLWKRHRADLLERKPFRNFRHSILGKDGSNLYRVCGGVPIFDASGDFKGYRGSATDITELIKVGEERRRALATAEEASRVKSEFLATVSHELRTPLNAILGFAEIISRQVLGTIEKPKYIEYANDIHTSGKYLLELVNDILDISTIEAGRRPLSKEKLSISKTISECAKSISARAGENGITLSTQVPKNLPAIHADNRAIKQVLINLLSNAVKFTPPGGMITVHAEAENGSVTIKVSDTGPGIPEEEISNLMEPFAKGDLDPYVAQEGAGLGLAISDSLIKMHDGELEIKSPPGQGTSVSITLPQGTP